jgi:hypothetical protein
MDNNRFQNGNGDDTGSEPDQQTDDDQLINLLNDLHVSNEAYKEALKNVQGDTNKVPKPVKDQLEIVRNNLARWCEEHLRKRMKAIMFQLFGPQIAKDGSLRFTVLWNDLLVKVLKSGRLKAPEGDVIRSLTSYFSNVLANQARDYLRRRKRLGKILDDEIKPLVELREKYLRENYDIDLEFLLEKVEEWENSGESVGMSLRLRYIDGMTYEQIARVRWDVSSTSIHRRDDIRTNRRRDRTLAGSSQKDSRRR